MELPTSAFDAGAPSIGFNITLPDEQNPNYITPELSFRFHYFAMRKMHLAMRHALAIFPAVSARWTNCSSSSPAADAQGPAGPGRLFGEGLLA
jgi:hypothetical protein